MRVSVREASTVLLLLCQVQTLLGYQATLMQSEAFVLAVHAFLISSHLDLYCLSRVSY